MTLNFFVITADLLRNYAKLALENTSKLVRIHAEFLFYVRLNYSEMTLDYFVSTAE